MNCFSLVTSIQTTLNQRLIFLRREINTGLQTHCPHIMTGMLKTIVGVLISQHCKHKRDLMATAANSTNYEGHFNGTRYYLSCCFKCFAHLFPLNISSSLKYSFNFLFKFFTSLFAVAIFLPPF